MRLSSKTCIFVILLLSTAMIPSQSVSEEQSVISEDEIYSQGFSIAVDVKISNNNAYLIDEGKGMTIYDITTPTNPSKVSSYSLSSANLVIINDTIAFIADNTNGEVHLVDVSDTSNPTLLGMISISFPSSFDEINSISIDGIHAYLATDNGIYVYDISDPTSPTLVSLNFEGTHFADMPLNGSYGYGITYNNLTVIDLSNPSNLIVTGTTTEIGLQTVGADFNGSHVYMATDGGFEVVDITDPSNPTILSSVSATFYIQDVTIEGAYGYLAIGRSGIWIYNFTNSYSSPSLTTYFTTSGHPLVTAVNGNYMYVADRGSGLLVYDVSDQSSPTVVTSRDGASDSFKKIIQKGDTIFALSQYDGLHSFEFDQDILQPLDFLDFPGDNALDMDIRDDILYIVDFDRGLHLVNISNPTNLVYENTITPGTIYPVEFKIQGDLGLVGSSLDGLRIVNISDPTYPVIGSYSNGIGELTVHGNYVIADSFGVLDVIDIADPTNPTMVSEVSGIGGTSDYVVADPYLYLSDYGDNAVKVYNISDFTNIQLLNSYSMPSPLSIYKYQNILTIAGEGTGLEIHNITNPTSFQLLGNYSSTNEYYDIKMTSTHLLAAANKDGLQSLSWDIGLNTTTTTTDSNTEATTDTGSEVTSSENTSTTDNETSSQETNQTSVSKTTDTGSTSSTTNQSTQFDVSLPILGMIPPLVVIPILYKRWRKDS